MRSEAARHRIPTSRPQTIRRGRLDHWAAGWVSIISRSEWSAAGAGSRTGSWSDDVVRVGSRHRLVRPCAYAQHPSDMADVSFVIPSHDVRGTRPGRDSRRGVPDPSDLGRRPSGPDCLTSNSGRTVTRRRFVEIRSALARGERVGALAEDYGVHKSTISRIKHGVRRRSS